YRLVTLRVHARLGSPSNVRLTSESGHCRDSGLNVRSLNPAELTNSCLRCNASRRQRGIGAVNHDGNKTDTRHGCRRKDTAPGTRILENRKPTYNDALLPIRSARGK